MILDEILIALSHYVEVIYFFDLCANSIAGRKASIIFIVFVIETYYRENVNDVELKNNTG